jgi:hypothetical protein
MLDIGFSRQLAKINLKDRALICDGEIVYRLADKSGHVSLPPAEWHGVIGGFDQESKLILRRARRLLFGLFPGILVFGMTLGQILPGAGILILAAFFLGPPAIYLWQSNRVQRLAAAIDAELARRPRVAAPCVPSPHAPRWLEIAFVLLFGPHLILEVYGSFDPHAFDGTPLMGTQLSWPGIAGFAVLAAILFLRWHRARTARSSWQGQAKHREPLPTPAAPATKTFGRRVDPIVPARETAS